MKSKKNFVNIISNIIVQEVLSNEKENKKNFYKFKNIYNKNIYEG